MTERPPRVRTVAVLADIHANLDALVAVLADVAAVAPELIVVAGDLIGGGLAPGGDTTPYPGARRAGGARQRRP